MTFKEVLLLFAAATLAAQTPPKPVLGTVTEFKTGSNSIEIGVKPADGRAVFIRVGLDTEIVRVLPGAPDLKRAGGGPPIGNSTTTTNSWELTNASIWTRGTHTIKWGGRVRESLLSDRSFANFAGTFTFFTVDRFRETLALQRAGYTGAQIAQLGAGPSQFSLNAGTPTTKVNQTDVGLWVNDDWRARPNLTVSIGLRYEAQTNAGRLHDWAPRLSIAWGLDGKSSHPAKTVLRAGFGTFYDRIPNTVTLNALRCNGTSQQSYLIRNPTFFPEIPPLSALQANQQPQQLQPVYSAIQSPRIYQTSAGLERQFNQQARMTVTYIHSRGVHLLNSRNINAPINGVFPFADRGIRLLTESNGRSRLNQLVVSPNVNYRGLVLFGFYSLSYGMDDASYGMNISNPLPPADPYNLRAEWGPSTYGDVRHRLMLATSISLPRRFSIMPFVIANSGQPYNITTGLDPRDTGFASARPTLASGISPSNCRGSGLVYKPAFGCFDLNPARGTPTIPQNYGRGPATGNLGSRISRTWAFGARGETGPADQSGPPPGMGDAKSSGPARPSGTGMHGGPPPGVFAPNSGRKYSSTLTLATLNALNRANFAPPNGDLSSPYFGQSRSLADLMEHLNGASTYNRRIDVQLRLTF